MPSGSHTAHETTPRVCENQAPHASVWQVGMAIGLLFLNTGWPHPAETEGQAPACPADPVHGRQLTRPAAPPEGDPEGACFVTAADLSPSACKEPGKGAHYWGELRTEQMSREESISSPACHFFRHWLGSAEVPGRGQSSGWGG